MASSSWGYEACTTNLPQASQAEDAMSAQMAGISSQIADLREMLGARIHLLEAQQAEAGNELMHLRARLLDVLTLPAAPQRAIRLDRMERLNRLFRRLESLEKSVGREQSECIRMLEVVLTAVEKNGTIVSGLSQNAAQFEALDFSGIGHLDAVTMTRNQGQALFDEALNNQSLPTNHRITQHGLVNPTYSPGAISQLPPTQRVSLHGSSENPRPIDVQSAPQTPSVHPLHHLRAVEPSVFQPTPQQSWNQHGGLTIVLDASLVERAGHPPGPLQARPFNAGATSRRGVEAALASPVALPPPPRPAPSSHLLGISPAPHLASTRPLKPVAQILTSASNQNGSSELRRSSGISQPHRSHPMNEAALESSPMELCRPTSGASGGLQHSSMASERQKEPPNQPSFAPLHPLHPYPTAFDLRQNITSRQVTRDLPEELQRFSAMDGDPQATLVRQFDTQVSSVAPTVSLEWNPISSSTLNINGVDMNRNLSYDSGNSFANTVHADTYGYSAISVESDGEGLSRRAGEFLRSELVSSTSFSPGLNVDREQIVASANVVHQPDSKRYSLASHSSSASETDTSQLVQKPVISKQLEVSGRLSSGEDASSSSGVVRSNPTPASKSGQTLEIAGRLSSGEDVSSSSEGESSPAPGMSSS